MKSKVESYLISAYNQKSNPDFGELIKVKKNNIFNRFLKKKTCKIQKISCPVINQNHNLK